MWIYHYYIYIFLQNKLRTVAYLSPFADTSRLYNDNRCGYIIGVQLEIIIKKPCQYAMVWSNSVRVVQ